MKLLALDQSVRCTGYAIFNNNVLEKKGVIKVGRDRMKRLMKIRNDVKDIIQREEIDFVVIEDIQLQSNVANNVQTFKVLAQLMGVLDVLFSELDIPYDVVSPMTWKAHFKFAGKGRAEEKEMARRHITSNYRIECTSDEADAACIGEYYCAVKL